MVSRETAPLLEIHALYKQYGSLTVLAGVSLAVPRGTVLSVLGRSGSGKSTLLRCIAGLECVDRGTILVDGRDLTHVPTHRRGIGMMFQQFALFPHRSVAENIAFGLHMRGDSRAQQQQRVSELLELVGLEGYGARDIFALSGGEQQRVALARSLAPNPPLLLLDEPMSSLDQSLKERLIREIRDILRQVDITALYITHDQNEAFTVADELVLLEAGRIVQQGEPEAVYRRPVNRFAAEFFGIRNILPVTGRAEREARGWRVQSALGMLTLPAEQTPQPFVAIPAESVEIVDNGRESVDKLENLLRGAIKSRAFRGGYYEILVEHGDGLTMTWEVEHAPPVGSVVTLHAPPHLLAFLAP